MADFCKQCSEELFGEDSCDFKNLNRLEHVYVLCEGCGHNCIVDFTGTCVSVDCLKQHGKQEQPGDDMLQQEQEIARYYATDE